MTFDGWTGSATSHWLIERTPQAFDLRSAPVQSSSPHRCLDTTVLHTGLPLSIIQSTTIALQKLVV